MADVTITAANVLESTGAKTEVGIAGEACSAGKPVYKKTADGKFYIAGVDGDEVSANGEQDNVYGIALNTAAGANQPMKVQTAGKITIGGTVAVGTTYVVSQTAGAICPWADLVATDYVSLVGIATTTGVIKLSIEAFGVQIPA